jgi:hypothetical protein
MPKIIKTAHKPLPSAAQRSAPSTPPIGSSTHVAKKAPSAAPSVFAA